MALMQSVNVQAGVISIRENIMNVCVCVRHMTNVSQALMCIGKKNAGS